MNVRKLYYFVRRGFPGSRANHIQSAKMCDAFRSVGVDTTVVAPVDTGESAGAVAERLALRAPLDSVVLAHPPAIADWTPLRDWIIRRALHSFVGGLNGIRGQTVLYGRTSRNYPMAQLLDRPRSPEGEKVVCEVHDADMTEVWLRRLGRADALVVISKALRNHLIERGLDANRILVAPDGVEFGPYERLEGESREEIRRRLGLPTDRRLVGFTGSLEANRGAAVLVGAAERLDADVQLVVIGGRNGERSRLEALARERGAESKVIFVGHQPHGRIPMYQAAMDVLLMAYGPDLQTRQWCSPLKMFEYMASGRPIVTSDLPALREVLRHEENALYTPAGDGEAIARAVERLLSDGKLAGELARRAQDDVRAYSWDERARRILEFASVRMS